MRDGLEVLGEYAAEKVEAAAKEDGFQRPKYHVTAGSKAGDNYLGIVSRVHVVEEVDVDTDVTSGRSASLIVKCQPSSESRRTVFRTKTFFAKEAFVYNTILPAFKGFQEARGLTGEQAAPVTAHCYHAGELLVMEDMCARGYRMLDRLDTLDAQCCAVVLRELGRLHAVSLAMRDQQPREYHALTNDLQETFLIADQSAGINAMLGRSVSRAVDKFTEMSASSHPGHVAALQRFHGDFYAIVRELTSADSAATHAVVNHGDCWTNNFLFGFDKDGVTPARLCFLDFQIARHASPAVDFSYFIYCCTDQSLRDGHYDDLVDEYYRSLAQHVRRLGSDPDKLFSFADLKRHLSHYARYGVFMAALTIPLFTRDAAEVPDLDAMCDEVDPTTISEQMYSAHSNEALGWQRFNDVVLDIVQRGYPL